MSRYRRTHSAGGTWFFTVVTYRRRGFLVDEASRRHLRAAIAATRRDYPFVIDAWVLMPEHLHCIWTLPAGDADYSTRWALIKRRFTQQAGASLHRPDCMTPSKHKHREGTVWQRRFFEHGIRDQEDLNTHMDYLHYNPVKHGLVARVADWPWSSFHRWVAQGVYPLDWASGPDELYKDGFGE